MKTPISRRGFVKTSLFASAAVPLALGAQTPPASHAPAVSGAAAPAQPDTRSSAQLEKKRDGFCAVPFSLP
jgi:hypothetical protein